MAMKIMNDNTIVYIAIILTNFICKSDHGTIWTHS